LWCSNTEDCSPLGGGYCNPNQINRTHNDITNELCGVCVNEQTDKLSCSEKKSNLCVYKEGCYPYFKDIKISLFNHIECSSGTTIRQNDDYGNECGVCTIEQGYTFPDLLKYGIGYEGQRCLDNGRAYRYYLVDESSGTIRTKLVWCQKDEVCVQTYDGGLSSSSEAGCQHSPEEEKPELNAPQRPPFPPR